MAFLLEKLQSLFFNQSINQWLLWSLNVYKGYTFVQVQGFRWLQVSGNNDLFVDFPGCRQSGL